MGDDNKANLVPPPKQINISAGNIAQQFDNFKSDYTFFIEATDQTDLSDKMLVERMLMTVGDEVRWKFRERPTEIPEKSKKF